MAYKNLIYQTTTGTGTGDLTLSAVTGWRDLATAFGTGAGNPFVYVIRHQSAAEYEVGTGYMSDSTTLVRSAVVDSSNANAAVNFAAGTKDVWHSVPAADANNFVTQTLLDAKGDLIVASAADTAARLAVGADYTSLTARAGATNGVEWAASPASGSWPVKAGYWVTANGNYATTTPTLNQLVAIPFSVPTTQTYDRIGIYSTATAGSAVVRLGIYAAGSDGTPGALILDAGTVDCSAGTGEKSITISQSLTVGRVFLVAVAQGAAVSVYNMSSFTSKDSSVHTSMTNILASAYSRMFYLNSVSGALPDPFGTPTGILTSVAFCLPILRAA